MGRPSVAWLDEELGGGPHSKASSRPVFGEMGAQLFDGTPSAIHTGSRGEREPRASHSRTAPLGPNSASSISAISKQVCAVGGRPDATSGASASRAFANSRAESAASAKTWQLSGAGRRKRGGSLHALERLRVRLAGKAH